MKLKNKFLCCALLLVAGCMMAQGIVNIPLKLSVSKENHSKYLMNLKLTQLNYQYSSFLQEVPLHQQVVAQKRLATYYGDIGVGEGVGGNQDEIQTFKMLFDTGSCEFWIPGDDCSTERCQSHDRYKRSNTFHKLEDTDMSIQYLSGRVTGDMAEETIFLGDIKVPKQVIGVASVVEIPLLDEVVWDGIIGLAYPNQNLKEQGIDPVIDNIIKNNVLVNKGEKNQFAYYLGSDLGSITFGGADMRYKRSMNEDFVWAPIAEKNYWTLLLTDVKKYKVQNEDDTQGELVPKADPLCPTGCKTIVDTGTYLIYGPAEQVQGYLGDVVIDDCSQKKDLPNIAFELAGFPDEHGHPQIIELTLTPDDYVLEFEIDGEEDCVIGIGPDTEDSGWTLGQVFLKAFYTVFDRDQEAIGFVRSNPSPNPAPGNVPNDGTTDYSFKETGSTISKAADKHAQKLAQKLAHKIKSQMKHKKQH